MKRALDDDPVDDHSIPCGDARLGGRFRSCCRLPCCRKADRGGSSSEDEEDWASAPKRNEPPAHRALCRVYPLSHADPLHDEVARKLRRLEKFEIAVQGDDYADKTHLKTNTEALQYARAAAAVAGLEWRLSDELRRYCDTAQRQLEALKVAH